jgi:hypothetical protein
VVVGDTDIVPFSGSAPPGAGEMLTAVALLVDHDNVEAPPSVIEVGFATKEVMIGPALDAVVMYTCARPLPPYGSITVSRKA